MSTTTNNAPCIICEKEKTILKCSGCLVDFCFNYLVEYHQQLSKWSDKLETKSSIFWQTVPEQRTDLQKDSGKKINFFFVNQIKKGGFFSKKFFQRFFLWEKWI